MANLISAIQANVAPYSNSNTTLEPSERQEILDIAKEILIVKERLKAIFDFNKLCELGKKKGVIFSEDGKIVEDLCGKRLVADLEFNHNVMKETCISFFESHGYSYNPENELLSNGTVDTETETVKMFKGFFENQSLIAALNKKFQYVTLDAIYDVIDFEEVKYSVKLFMDSTRFLQLLKNRGWIVYRDSQDAYIVNLSGQAFDASSLDFKWKKQKLEVLHSLHFLGYISNKTGDQFIYHNKVLTIDEVYELIKTQVVDQLVSEAHSIGFKFDIEKKSFVKKGSEASVREVMIQVHLKHMRLEDIF